MASEWKTMLFSDAVEINPSVKLQLGKAYSFVSMQAVNPEDHWVISSEMREYTGGGTRFIHGDTLMARITPSLEHGKIVRYSGFGQHKEGFGSTEFIVLRGKDGITDNDFVYYLVKSPKVHQYAISQMTGTSGRQRVPAESLSFLEVNVPPLPEQRAIAHILGTLDDKIELNRRQSETLEAMARALFKSWFVDFEPVRAKMSPPSPRGRGAGGEGIYALFPDRLVESELGPIPEGWEVGKLGELVSVVRGRSYRSQDLFGGDTALVTLKSFQRGGGYRSDGLKPYSGVYEDEQVVVPGELIVAQTDITQAADVIGKPAIVFKDRKYKTLVASLDVAIVRPKSDRVSIPFLYYLLLEENFQNHAYSMSKGTTVLHLDKNAIPQYHCVIPSVGAMAQFTKITSSLFHSMHMLQEQCDILAEMRDTLLPKLISGQLRVAEAERFLKEGGL